MEWERTPALDFSDDENKGWYPAGDKKARRYLSPREPKVEAKGVVCPHAGWKYSGRIAGLVYGRLRPPDTWVVIGPNHHGLGDPVAVWPKGRWLTPLGAAEVDGELAEEILRRCSGLNASADAAAHSREHSIEVQLPFLRMISPQSRIVPISLSDYRRPTWEKLGAGIAEAAEKLDRRITVIASNDMTHYEPQEEARRKDEAAIRRMLELDPAGLERTARREPVTMCGLGPVCAMLVAAKAMAAKSADLAGYATSGDVTHEYESVVGYAGLIIS